MWDLGKRVPISCRQVWGWHVMGHLSPLALAWLTPAQGGAMLQPVLSGRVTKLSYTNLFYLPIQPIIL